MKNTIQINLGADHTLECAEKVIGRSGEGLVSRLEVTIPEALANYDVYIDFEKPNGEPLRTPKLEVEYGVAFYDVPKYLLDESGEIKVQLVFEKSNGTTWKSSKKRYTILKSINAVEDIPEKVDFIAQVQKLVDELSQEVTEIAEILANDAKFAQAVIDACGGQIKINTINGVALKFFVGKQAEYDELSDAQKQDNLFAIITDDATKEGILKAIENLQTGTTPAGNAKKVAGYTPDNFRGHGTNFTYKYALNVDRLFTEGHWFVVNAEGTLPSNINKLSKHFFLDVDYFNGTGFNPHGGDTEPISKQTLREYDSNRTWIRTYNHTYDETWAEWEQVAGEGTTVTNANNANNAMFAEDATNDGDGKNISTTYAKLTRPNGAVFPVGSIVVAECEETQLSLGLFPCIGKNIPLSFEGKTMALYIETNLGAFPYRLHYKTDANKASNETLVEGTWVSLGYITDLNTSPSVFLVQRIS